MKLNQKVGLQQQPFRIYSATDMTFPYHIHQTYEMIWVKKGFVKTVIDGVELVAGAGEGVVVFPLQYHSFDVDSNSAIRLYVFSPSLVPEFHTMMYGKLPERPIIMPDNALFEQTPDQNNVFKIKSFFYELCGDISQKLICAPSTKKDISLMDKIFLYVDQHYANECSLKQLSGDLKYDYYYLSKLFKEKTGVSYNTYLNTYRINHACYLLTNTQDKITEVAAKSGFDTLRTFNREFKIHKNVTPQEYRNAN